MSKTQNDSRHFLVFQVEAKKSYASLKKYLAATISHMNTLFHVTYSILFCLICFHWCGVLYHITFSLSYLTTVPVASDLTVFGSEILFIFLFTFSITSEQALRWAT